MVTRERLHRLAMATHHRLADCHEQRGEYEPALQHAWRQVELDPWHEEAHQQIMRLLALSGQRSEALAHYESCHRLLAEELSANPGAETTRLYEQIRDGFLSRGAREQGSKGAGGQRSTGDADVLPAHVAERVTFPPLLSSASPRPSTPAPFVAREQEIARLHGFLEGSLAGDGQVVFVTGGAGRGKTALIREFSRRTQEAHPDLIVAGGHCNAHTGIGDPYLPFREVLGLLTGDVEARWAAGTITHEHARRLWGTLPLTVQALVDKGADLIDSFVPGAALVARAVACAPQGGVWLERLRELVERGAAGPEAATWQQADLFEQYTGLLHTLASQAPLLLVLDDLQWADLGSISLLFHLGRRLTGSRILILGAYRPEEVASGRGGERHPLEPVINELRRELGEIAVDLSQAEEREFVEALLDSEPNRLGARFREMLYQRTRGHPLFTVELLRGMQERGDLVQDEAGRWMEGPAIDWEALPARGVGGMASRRRSSVTGTAEASWVGVMGVLARSVSAASKGQPWGGVGG